MGTYVTNPPALAVGPQSVTTVLVSNANAPAAAPLVVGGYDVAGEVRSDGEPMKEVTFLLYSASVHQEVSHHHHRTPTLVSVE